MKGNVHIDLETHSMADLKKVGVHRYARDPSTNVWCAAYAVDDGEIKLWVPGDPCPEEIIQAVADGYDLVAHNSQFERVLWREILTPSYGWPAPILKCWRCTMAMALAMSLPAGLGDAAAAVGLDHDKDMKGYRLMLQMCRPRRIEKDGTVVWWDDDARKQRLFDYCRTDIKVERALFKRLLPLRRQEQALWRLDQIINDRGVRIDRPLVEAARQVVDATVDELNREMREVTDDAVGACTNVGQLTAWLRDQGIKTNTVAKAALPELLYEAEVSLAGNAYRALELRQEAARSSTAKLKAMLSVAGDDERARGLFQYHAATTGRWGGRLLQPQNLPRPDLSRKEIEGAIGIISQGDVVFLDMMYGPPMGVVASCLRGMIAAAPGYELMTADFSAIEARVVAWLAGEKKVLEVFRGDGKIYEHAASGIYGVPVDAVTKDQRFIGKISILALGYQGGVGAFQAMAKAYGVEIDKEKAEEIKTAWRNANPNIVRFWRVLENAAIEAVLKPGAMVPMGPYLFFRKAGSFLWCRLPSGRTLCYPYPRVIDKPVPWGGTKPAITFKGVDTYTKKWFDQDTYGGKLAENVTQAVARDLLGDAMVRSENAGIPIVMHIHDELVVEVPDGTGDLEAFEKLMAETPSWAGGLPVQAEGWIGKRYRK